MTIRILHAGVSRSFPDGPPAPPAGHVGLLVLGEDAGGAYRRAAVAAAEGFVAIELGTECLAEHVGLDESDVHRSSVGFARFRLGEAEPSQLIEIVRQHWTDPEAVAAARAFFEAAGFKTAVCEDEPGRIVDRLLRPYFNAVLRRLDEKLASAGDMDSTLMMGLGYPEGPIALLRRSGLGHHHDVTRDLYDALGDSDFAPARVARVARRRSKIS